MIRLTVTNRKTNNRKVYELNQNTVVFGRAANCDVVLDSEFVSRRHAQLVVKRNLVELEDLGSGNGTLVNQKKLTDRERVPLKKGDKIRVEEFVINIEAEEETYIGPESGLKADKFEITDPDIIEIKMIKKILGAFDSDKRPCVVVVSAPFQHLRSFIEDDVAESPATQGSPRRPREVPDDPGKSPTTQGSPRRGTGDGGRGTGDWGRETGIHRRARSEVPVGD